MYVVCVVNYCDGEKTNLAVLIDLDVLSPHVKVKKFFLVCHLSVYMCALLPPEQ
jgi:hypothetical protein